MKNVIITGGSKGIGKAIANEFIRAGYKVIATYNNTEVERNENFIPYKCDVRDINQVKGLIKFAIDELGKIDVLINNAGVSYTGLLTDMNDDDFYMVTDTNFKGVYNTIHEITPHMVNNKEGKIINISSVWGICGASCEAVYSASKSAVIGLTKATAKELAPSNINVNAIAPGVILTDMLNEYTKQDLDDLISQTPLNRLGKPQDIANLALFLASDKADFITGQVICVDGGFIL